ncbi:hypothetical protein [Acetivibrio straminisolvens]|nr:hypothetical protein [Acetivibrio straminisolvens]
MNLAENIREIFEKRDQSKNIQLISGHKQLYKIQMRNYYLNSIGGIKRKQELNSTFSRTISNVIVPFLALTDYHFEAVNYLHKEGGKNIKWTFAEGLSFPHYLFSCNKPEEFELLSDKNIYSQVLKHCQKISGTYSSLPRLPSVYLLVMLTFDILAFEVFTSFICSTPALFDNPGKAVEIENLSNLQNEIGVGLYSKSSFFKNGTFYAMFLGYGKFGDNICSVFEYWCDESKVMVTENDEDASRSRKGYSYYSGRICLDVMTGLPVRGTMLESYIALQNMPDESETKKVPVHVRRNVNLELLDSNY